MRWWCVTVLALGCSGGGQGHEQAHEQERGHATPATTTTTHQDEHEDEHEDLLALPPSTGTSVTLHFAWPAPAEADVHVDSEHDFGEGVHVSVGYRYHLAVTRDERGYHLARTGLTLERHEGSERLRLGNVIVQDVTQHAGEVRIDGDGSHVVPVGAFDPIEAASRSALADAGIEGPLADAVLSLGRSGWEPLNVLDYDDMIHEWNGRSLVLAVIQPADAIGDVEATRIMSSASLPCDGATCVQVVRTEQAERGSDRIEHVYTLDTEAETLRPHRFEHEVRTDSETAHVHYAETWTTTYAWR